MICSVEIRRNHGRNHGDFDEPFTGLGQPASLMAAAASFTRDRHG